MTKEEIRNLLEKEAKISEGLDIPLLLAIIEVESSFNPWAVKFESRATLFNNPAMYSRLNGIDLVTEKTLQHTSWGLFQLMGFAARDMGYKDSLTKLLTPEVNIIWGVEYFKARCKRRFTKIEDQISAYNAGTPRKGTDGLYANQAYVSKVLGLYTK